MDQLPGTDNEIKRILGEIADLLFRIGVTTEMFRRQNLHRALKGTVQITDKISALLQDLMNKQELQELSMLSQTLLQVTDMLKELMEVQKNGDTILLADLMELKVLPWLMDVQSHFIAVMDSSIMPDRDLFLKNVTSWNKSMSRINESSRATEKFMEDFNCSACSYRDMMIRAAGSEHLEFTASGRMTLCASAGDSSVYLHGNQFPELEGYQLAESWYKDGHDRYSIYGLGLGYAVLGLFEVDSFNHVTVFESSRERCLLAFSLLDFSKWMDADQLVIYFDPDYSMLQKHREKKEKDEIFAIHYPSLQTIQDTKNRESLEDYFIQYSSIENQSYLLRGNFKKNSARNDENVEKLLSAFEGKDLYIVAAGPSLDKNFLELKKLKNGLILATGTVLRKLLKAGITPDYVIMTDAFDEVYEQVRGLEECGVPLLYLSSACAAVPQAYKGKKYIILQHEFEPAERKAAAENAMLFHTGGSVSTTAMELGIVFRCRRIVFLGLDLAFTDNLSHASETPRQTEHRQGQLREVDGINQNKVQTSRNMDAYRMWIEKRIERSRKEEARSVLRQIEFIDATEGGARVAGTVIMKLTDVIGEA